MQSLSCVHKAAGQGAVRFGHTLKILSEALRFLAERRAKQKSVHKYLEQGAAQVCLMRMNDPRERSSLLANISGYC